MNFWTFLDRNAFGALLLIFMVCGLVVVPLVAKGCHVRVGDTFVGTGCVCADGGAP